MMQCLQCLLPSRAITMAPSADAAPPASAARAHRSAVNDFLDECAAQNKRRRAHASRCKEAMKRVERGWLRRHKHDRFVAAQNSHEMEVDLRKWFDAIDADGSGQIDIDELEGPLRFLVSNLSRANWTFDFGVPEIIMMRSL